MIIYDKSFWGVILLGRVYGSAFPRTLPAAIFTALFTWVLSYFRQPTVSSWWAHPYPHQTIFFVVGFIIVFRCNLSYNRYWEGRTGLQAMTARWLDASIQIVSFDRRSKTDEDEDDECMDPAGYRFRRLFLHLISLLHATCCQALRRDCDLGNLTLHCSKTPMPPKDPINYDPNTMSRRNLQVDTQQVGRVAWADIFVLRASPAHLQKYNSAFPLPVIDGISTKEFKCMACGGRYPISSKKFLRTLDHSCCGAHLPYMERPYLVMAWIQELLVDRQRQGGLDVPAPILSRPYQLLSEGLTAFEQCRKLTDTPFPFPWAQFVMVLLVLHSFLAPILIVAYIRTTWLAVVLSVVSVVTYWALNEVARDMEDPFLYEPNELPLAKQQYDFNTALLGTGQSRRPLSNFEYRSDLCQTPSRPSSHSDSGELPEMRPPPVDSVEYEGGVVGAPAGSVMLDMVRNPSSCVHLMSWDGLYADKHSGQRQGIRSA